MPARRVTVQLSPIEVTIQSTGERIVAGSPQVRIITAGKVGPSGPAGDDELISLIAATVLSGQRVVTTDINGEAIYADKDTPAHVSKVLGICLTAATVGASVDIRTFGELTEPAWNWNAGEPIYLSTNGTMTQTVPLTGFLLQVAFALTPTSIFVSLQQPFVRS